MIPRQVVSALPETMLETEVVRPHSTPADSEFMGVRPGNLF